jgi:hypothetical protein
MVFIEIHTFPNIDTLYNCSNNIIRYDNIFSVAIVMLFEYAVVLTISKPWKFASGVERCGRAISMLLLFCIFSASFPHFIHCSNKYSMGHMLWTIGCVTIVMTEIVIVGIFFIISSFFNGGKA